MTFIQKTVIIHDKEVLPTYFKKVKPTSFIKIPEKFTTKELDTIFKVFINDSLLLNNCSRLQIFIYVHGSIEETFIINDSITYDDFESLLLKYFNTVPVNYFIHCCRGIFFQQLIMKLLPTSNVVTFTDSINNICVTPFNFYHLDLDNPTGYLYDVIKTNYYDRLLFLLITKKHIDGSISYVSFDDQIYENKIRLRRYYHILNVLKQPKYSCRLRPEFDLYFKARQLLHKNFLLDWYEGNIKTFYNSFQRLYDFDKEFRPPMMLFEHSNIELEDLSSILPWYNEYINSIPGHDSNKNKLYNSKDLLTTLSFLNKDL